MKEKNYSIRNAIVKIIVFAICFGLIGFLLGYIFIKPVYRSTTTVYVKYDRTFSSAGINTVKQFDNDCKGVIKSRTTLNNVIAILNLRMSVYELGKITKVSINKDSHLVNVTVTYSDAVKAKEIADAIVECSGKTLVEKVDATGIEVVDKADVSTNRVRPGLGIVTIIALVIGIALTTVYVLLVDKKDQYIRSEADIEQYLGIKVLTSIN